MLCHGECLTLMSFLSGVFHPGACCGSQSGPAELGGTSRPLGQHRHHSSTVGETALKGTLHLRSLLHSRLVFGVPLMLLTLLLLLLLLLLVLVVRVESSPPSSSPSPSSSFSPLPFPRFLLLSSSSPRPTSISSLPRCYQGKIVQDCAGLLVQAGRVSWRCTGEIGG